MNRARIDKLVSEIDAAILTANARRDAEVEALQKRRAVLMEARAALNPQLEALLAKLQEIGLL